VGSGRTVAIFVSGALLAAASVTAQRWGTEEPPRDGVCFYDDSDFHGDYFCVRAGEGLRSLPIGMNDRISSLRILGRAEVEVFADSDYEGASGRFDSNVRHLRSEGWNDVISSVRVRYASSHDHHGDERARGDHGEGSHSSRYHGEDPDRIVRRAYQDILDREPDTGGLRLYRSRIIDDGWSESQVRDALRDSPEYREKHTMTRTKAEQIVRNAYLSVLQREPDPGSRSYVDRVLRDKWTQQDVERDLRKSPEYRSRR
jgi:hypothetical protein